MNITEKLQNKATKPLWKRILVQVSFARSSEKALKTAFDIARARKRDVCAALIIRIHLSQEEREQEAVVRARSLQQSLMRSLKNDE